MASDSRADRIVVRLRGTPERMGYQHGYLLAGGYALLLLVSVLVHEAYLKLVDQRRVQWQNRAHFFAVAARLMRQILVDHARAHRAAKRGGDAPTLTVSDDVAGPKARDLDVLALNDALEKLAEINPQQGQTVELRFFSGLSIEETSDVLGISPATVKRHWTAARAWLFREMKRG